MSKVTEQQAQQREIRAHGIWRRQTLLAARALVEVRARQGVADLAEVLGITLDADRTAWLADATLAELDEARAALKQHRAWPGQPPPSAREMQNRAADLALAALRQERREAEDAYQVRHEATCEAILDLVDACGVVLGPFDEEWMEEAPIELLDDVRRSLERDGVWPRSVRQSGAPVTR